MNEPLEREASVVESGDGERDRGDAVRRRVWWLVALLLLLVLVSCIVLQFLMPASRAPRGKKTAGITPVFSIYGLTQPLGVAAGPEGEIVVSDTGVQRAYLFDRDGALLARLGDDKVGSKVFSPDGSAYVDDTVYLTDWNMRRVWAFDKQGRVSGYFPENPTSKAFGKKGFTPYDIVVFGDDLLVTSSDGIHRFDGRTKKYLGRFDRGKADGRALDFPNGIAVSKSGESVFVADTLNRRVVAYDAQGRPRWWLGRPDKAGRVVSLFGLPRGVVITKRGLLVSDTFSHRLVLLDEDGKLLGKYGKRGVVDGQLNFPEGLDVAPDGLVYIADRENNRVQVVSLGDPLKPDVEMRRKWREDYGDAQQ